TTLQNGDVKVRLEISKDYNDNTYQEKNTTPIYAIGWPNDKHDFKALHKSDKAEFEIFDNNGNSIVRFELDYLEQGMSGYPSGYGPRIENIVSGNINYIKDINSSLSRNFNDYGYVLTQHSPATDNNYTPNSNYPNWEFSMIYEFTVDQSANFGNVDVVSLHNSPNKLGTSNQVFPGVCSSSSGGKASIGDKVWHDEDCDGIQDDTELGISGVTVELYDCDGNYVDVTTTDFDGNYSFTDLTPGDYYLKFYLPNGYVFSPKNASLDSSGDSGDDHSGDDGGDVDNSDGNGDDHNGDGNGDDHNGDGNGGDHNGDHSGDSGSSDSGSNSSDLDSDADINTGMTVCTTLSAGENDMSWDAGMCSQVSTQSKIGDFVWHDKNYNGIQDAGEPGIENVIVNLIQNNSVIATTTTDANGYYEFNNLSAGSYDVEIDASNFASNGVLKNAADEKWYASPKNQGSDDAVDSDGDETTHKAPVTLTNADDLTVDFGFF
ncbi:MAG: hypothetical protein D6732_12480, partial [Methanobacteriota archaeon]